MSDEHELPPGHEGHDHHEHGIVPHEADPEVHDAGVARRRGARRGPRSRTCPHRAPGARPRSRRPGLRRRGRRPGAAPDRGPRGPLPGPRRAHRHAPAAAEGLRARGRRDRPHDPQGRDPGAGRRVRLREDDDRPRGRQARRSRRRAGSCSTARTSARSGGPSALRPYRKRVQLIFQDPYETLDPKHTIGSFVEEPLLVGKRLSEGGTAAARPRGARGRGPAPGDRLRGALSPRALRRAAAAGGDRRRPGDGPGAGRGRRAGVDAGRLDPDRAPAADARAAARARPHLPVHHPRPRDRLGARRPDRRDVPRQADGDRAGRAGHPGAAQPVHAGPRLGVAVHRPARARRACAHDPRRRDAGRRARARRVPVPPTLPARVRPVPRRRAAAGRGGRRPPRGVLARDRRARATCP